jgi:hypothetical protein
MLDKIGLFDEDFFCLYEDVDLSFRAQIYGFTCLYVPAAVVYHIVGGTAGVKNHFTVYFAQRNLEAVWVKNMPAKIFLKYLSFHFVYNVLALFYNLKQKKGITFLRSKTAALLQIQETLRKRKIIQGNRRVPLGYLERMFDRRSLARHTLRVL